MGGTKKLYSASINLIGGQQNYDLQTILSSSGVITAGQRVEVKEMFYFSPTAAYRFFDTTSAVNYLHNQFKFESFTPETVFYMLPVWEDVLRAQTLEMSQRIRRSNYSYNIVNNSLKIYPVPSSNTTLFFTYFLANDDPFENDGDPLLNGISNLNNVPFGNINFTQINSIGKQWIRRFAFSLSKETLGQVRSKVNNIPIPNGDLQLNGGDLVIQAREEQNQLREELRGILEEMTYQNLALKETEAAEALKRQLAGVPLGISIG